MTSFVSSSKVILSNEKGQGLTEYLVLLLLVAVISIGAVRTLGSTIQGKLEMAERHIMKVQLDEKGGGKSDGPLGGVMKWFK